jgi:hypothetical protein
VADDYVGFEIDQFSRKPLKLTCTAGSKPMVDADVASFQPSASCKAGPKCREARFRFLARNWKLRPPLQGY